MDRSQKEEPQACPSRQEAESPKEPRASARAAPPHGGRPIPSAGGGQTRQVRYFGAASAFFVVLWIALMAGGGRMLRDPGTLWHTVVGEKILQSGECIRTDPFTFTHHGQQWLAQQWLGECAMALIHRLCGLDGLILATATLLAGLFAWLAARLMRNGLPWPAAVLLVLLVIAASSYHFIPRPHLFTILFLAAGLALLTDIESGKLTPRWLLVIPPAMVLWTNIHGGALGGIATLYIVLMGWLLRPARKPHGGGLPFGGPDLPRRPGTRPASPQLIALTLGLSTAAILVNPYGTSLPTVWLALMDSELLPRFIIEHAPLNLLSTEGLMILTLAAAYLGMLAASWRQGLRICWLVPLVWLALAISRVRHGPLFAVTAAIAMADMLPYVRFPAAIAGLGVRHLTGSQTDRGRGRPGSLGCWLIPATLVLSAAVLQVAGVSFPIIGAGRARPDPTYWPVEATEALRRHIDEHPAERRVFNDMRFGGYLIYHLPHAQIYIDDRCELHADSGLRRYVELREHPDRMAGLADYEDVHLALVQTRSPLVRYFANNSDWTRLHEDHTASLYRRNPR